ncbi:MAG: DUF177 domain-containing protein [Comamonas sp.]|nr:DUF177 domain-containing protein [Candidatus Comamonas equi]
MSKEYSLDHLDVAAFAKANAVLEGEDPLSAFERLSQEAQASVEGASVAWYAEGEHVPEAAGPGHLWLHIEADAQVPMVCQRCLHLAQIDLQVQRSFRFVRDEATAEALDDEADEDLLALSKEFNLRELLEDELLMALPLVPMHDECPEQVPTQAVSDDFDDASSEKTNPFAVLAGLRKNNTPD